MVGILEYYCYYPVYRQEGWSTRWFTQGPKASKTGVKVNLRSPAPEPTFLLCFYLTESGIDCVTDQVSLFTLTTQLPCYLSHAESVQTLEMCALGVSFTPSFTLPACFRLTLHHTRFFPLFMSIPLFVVVQSQSHVWLSMTPWTAAYQASLSFIISLSLLKLMSTESVMPSNYLILSHPLLLLPSVFPSIRVFSSKLALHIGWSHHSPKHPFGKMVSNFKNNNKNKCTGDSSIK